jgi:hypothetical protein
MQITSKIIFIKDLDDCRDDVYNHSSQHINYVKNSFNRPK